MKTLQEIKELAEKAKNGGAAYGEFLDHLDGETITALIGLVERCERALEVSRDQVLAVCEHNEGVNGGYLSVVDRKDLGQIDRALQSIKDFGKE